MSFASSGKHKPGWFSISILFVVIACGFVLVSIGTAAAPVTSASPIVSSSSLGEFAPTFAGPAATGCDANGCALLTGPFATSAIEPAGASATAKTDKHRAMPLPSRARRMAHPLTAAAVAPPSVSCEPLGPGCDVVDRSSGGAVGVKGLNAVDSAEQATNLVGDIEPPDQGLCVGNGYVAETNNLGEVLVFGTALQRRSSVLPLDTIMGLTERGWSSGGDPSCLYDPDNGGHWIFTEIVSASSEASGGPFAGCFVAVANACYEGIAVTNGPSPFGPYSVYFLNANYNPAEPGYPYLLNDYAKIAITRDAFLIFYDEFPLQGSGLGGGFFNGAQELAFNKRALELGLSVVGSHGQPNPNFTVAIENMGLLPTPDGSCFSDNVLHLPGVTCWIQVIPANPPDATQFDNSHGGSGFMVGTLDFYGNGDTRFAVFDWTGLASLNSPDCSTCSNIQFGGQLFAGVDFYYGEGFPAPQKKGPIPLGNECGAAGLSKGTPPPASCPEGELATNGDGVTQVSQANHQLWLGISTEIAQTYSSGPSPEIHQGALYWIVGTGTFDSSGFFTLTNQAYVSPIHEELEFPTLASGGTAAQDGGTGRAIISFTLSGNGGPTHADSGGFFPSSAYGRLTEISRGLAGARIYIADLGQSPQDGFTEYQGYPGRTRPRWGDYGAAIFMPNSGGRIYFASEYIQYKNCTGAAFTLSLGTCGGTRDGFANWGTSVNYVVP
jgi:hypothetical protein